MVLFIAIGLLALFSCGLLVPHMLMGHGELCRLDSHLVPISPNRESLLLNLLLSAIVFILLYTSTRQDRNLDLSKHNQKGPFDLFGQENNFSIFNPVSAFVLVRTVQRHVY